MKIQLTIYPQGGVECNNKICHYRKQCANHGSAGDYRYEDGMTPNLQINSIFLAGAEATCHTADGYSLNLEYFGAKFLDRKKLKLKIHNNH